ncbi:MAG: hypothetical protein AAGA29_10450 [Planctomycetota bacterium]
MPSRASLRNRFAGVDPKLLIAVGVLALVLVVVLIWTNRGGGRDIGKDKMVFYCHFDDGEVTVNAEDIFKWHHRGDAVLGRGVGPPTRVRCPECDRPSCFMKNSVTGEEIEVDESWDLETWPETTSRGGDAVTQ